MKILRISYENSYSFNMKKIWPKQTAQALGIPHVSNENQTKYKTPTPVRPKTPSNVQPPPKTPTPVRPKTYLLVTLMTKTPLWV